MERFTELSLAAQTTYAELLDQTMMMDLSMHTGNLHGSFQKKTVKNRVYWYFAWRDLAGRVQQLYVGPDSERVRKLLDELRCDWSGRGVEVGRCVAHEAVARSGQQRR